MIARGDSHLMGLGRPSEQVPGQDLGVGGRDEAFHAFGELPRRGREELLAALTQMRRDASGSEKNSWKASTLDSPIPLRKSKPSTPYGATDATAAAATTTSGSRAALPSA